MKKFKRMVAIAVSIVVCFMVNLNTPIHVLKAASETQVTEGSWTDVGNYTNDWVSSITGQDVYGNQGTASDPYEIRNEEDLAGLSYCSNVLEMYFVDKYINIIAEELDMSQHFWEPIGVYNPIHGTINGNGCVINNLFIGSEDAPYEDSFAGLFGQSYADINNVNVKNFIYYDTSYCVGGLLGSWESGTIDGCSAEGIIVNDFSDCSMGGLIGTGQIEEGDALGAVLNCSAEVQIESYVTANAWEQDWSGNVGGLIGSLYAEAEVENCTVDTQIDVGSNYFVGGLVGTINADTTLSTCSVTYNISTEDDCLASGLVGRSRSCTLLVSNCNTSGTVIS